MGTAVTMYGLMSADHVYDIYLGTERMSSVLLRFPFCPEVSLARRTLGSLIGKAVIFESLRTKCGLQKGRDIRFADVLRCYFSPLSLPLFNDPFRCYFVAYDLFSKAPCKRGGVG